MDGLALSISIGLQYGVPLKALVDKLTNTRFEPSGFTENSSIRYASSVLDYIARWVGGKFLSPEYLKPRTVLAGAEIVRPLSGSPAENSTPPKSIHPRDSSGTTGDAPSCPTCGMLMVPNGSCYKASTAGVRAGVRRIDQTVSRAALSWLPTGAFAVSLARRTQVDKRLVINSRCSDHYPSENVKKTAIKSSSE
jgi:hypothetical protein